MPRVEYGDKIIEYSIVVKENLKAHYISVEKGKGVELKGKAISEAQAQQLILKKAAWILDKLELVRALGQSDIVTGARVAYLGRMYYVEVCETDQIKSIEIQFNQSTFKVLTPKNLNKQENLIQAFEAFYKQKAIEKISSKVRKWSKKLNLPYNQLKFMQLEKRWGSCTPSNNIILNIDAIKLPFSLIDYLIVHELVHTKIKNHSKAFWVELSRHLHGWKALDERMSGMKM
jgi:predicted metal-dependent hydrolase